MKQVNKNCNIHITNIRLSRLAYLCCHTHFAYKTTLNYCYTYYQVKKTAWSKFLEVGVGIKTIQVVSQALVAEDVLLLWRKYLVMHNLSQLVYSYIVHCNVISNMVAHL